MSFSQVSASSSTNMTLSQWRQPTQPEQQEAVCQRLLPEEEIRQEQEQQQQQQRTNRRKRIQLSSFSFKLGMVLAVLWFSVATTMTTTITITTTNAFVIRTSTTLQRRQQQRQRQQYHASLTPRAAHPTTATTVATTKTASFIDNDMRQAAMQLHTKQQAPKEGKAESKQRPRRTQSMTTSDYIQYLVDSHAVYQALEDIVAQQNDFYAEFRNTGLERTAALQQDLEYWRKRNDNDKDTVAVGPAGQDYVQYLHSIADDVPKFVCHFYNFYFAHTAGGRQIGKLIQKTLVQTTTTTTTAGNNGDDDPDDSNDNDSKPSMKFFEWDEAALPQIKAQVKENLETLIQTTWSETDKQACLDETAQAFVYAGALNAYIL